MREYPPALTWVPIGPRQSKEILRLMRAMEERDATPYRTSHEEILEYFDSTHFWRATAARDYSGNLIAFGLTRMPAAHGLHAEVALSGGVHPDFRGFGVGRQLLRMQLATAEQLVQGESDSAAAVMHVDAGHADLEDLLSRAGFSVASSYVQMRKPLKDVVRTVEPPSFVTIEPFTTELTDEVRKAHNAIFSERSSYPPLNSEQWSLERRDTHEPWSFVAVDRRGDRPRIAGYLLSGRFEQDWAALGFSEGYIHEVAVQKEWRGLHVMRVLLETAMTLYQSEGIEFAGLDANVALGNEDSIDGIANLFEHFGFAVTGRTSIFARRLDIRPMSANRSARRVHPTE